MAHDTPEAAALPLTLRGKTVLVTGAARRVGATIARTLHAAGANLVLHYRSSADDAAALAEALNAVRPTSATLVECDLLETARLPTLIEKAVAEFGGLDILVNNAAPTDHITGATDDKGGTLTQKSDNTLEALTTES